MVYVRRWVSPLGGITMASDGDALVGLWFDGQKGFPAGLADAPESGPLPVFGETVRWLERYFSGGQPDFTPKLAPTGTPYRLRVWSVLMTIPYGRTAGYGEIARAAAEGCGAAGMSARAAGGAVGRNPIAIIIPCHRVVGADGGLTGYAGGIWRKAALLRLEGVVRTAPSMATDPRRSGV